MPFSSEDCQRARSAFPALARRLDEDSSTTTPSGTPFGERCAFLDGPAGTQMPQVAIDAISHYYQTANANTHGQFITSIESDAVVDDVRAAVADLLGTPEPGTISIGNNMTTLNFALSRAIGRTLSAGDEVVITQLDHEANRGPWRGLEEQGVVVRELLLRPDGTLDPASFADTIGPKTKLVAVGMSSNALGTVNDVVAIGKRARDVGAWLLLDAVHFAPHFPIDVQALDPDFLLCSAYKFYGPHVGFLYARPGLLATLTTDVLHTQDPGAPYCIETGTLNHAALAGVTAAIDFLASWGEGETRRAQLVDAITAIGAYEHTLARRYHDQVAKIPGVTVHGPGFDTGRRAPTVSITVDGQHPTNVAKQLGNEGLFVWDGDFYAARPVEVLGLAAGGGLIRVGISMYNTDNEIDRLLDALGRAAKRSAN